MQRAEHRVAVLVGDPARERAGSGSSVKPTRTSAPGSASTISHASVLPWAQAEVLARERAARVVVDGQALAGVEQLDEQRGVGAEAGDVLGAEARLGVGGDGVADERAVREAAEPPLGPRRTTC